MVSRRMVAILPNEAPRRGPAGIPCTTAAEYCHFSGQAGSRRMRRGPGPLGNAADAIRACAAPVSLSFRRCRSTLPAALSGSASRATMCAGTNTVGMHRPAARPQALGDPSVPLQTMAAQTSSTPSLLVAMKTAASLTPLQASSDGLDLLRRELAAAGVEHVVLAPRDDQQIVGGQRARDRPDRTIRRGRLARIRSGHRYNGRRRIRWRPERSLGTGRERPIRRVDDLEPNARSDITRRARNMRDPVGRRRGADGGLGRAIAGDEMLAQARPHALHQGGGKRLPPERIVSTWTSIAPGRRARAAGRALSGSPAWPRSERSRTSATCSPGSRRRKNSVPPRPSIWTRN